MLAPWATISCCSGSSHCSALCNYTVYNQAFALLFLSTLLSPSFSTVPRLHSMLLIVERVFRRPRSRRGRRLRSSSRLRGSILSFHLLLVRFVCFVTLIELFFYCLITMNSVRFVTISHPQRFKKEKKICSVSEYYRCAINTRLMTCSVKNMIICIVEHGTLSLHSISSRRIICIFDARSISCFCGYLKDDNWLRSSDPFARSLQYVPRYTSRTVFRRVIVIFHRNLIFVKKSDRIGCRRTFRPRSTTSFPYPCFLQYLSCKL